MSWRFVLPGAPPSWNKSYQITEQHRLRPDGSQQTFRTLSKRKEVVEYQDDVIPIIRAARPSNWNPPGQVRVLWDIFLGRDIDCDNLMKIVHDAIERATGVNDRRYLPCVRSKQTGLHPRQVRVEIEIIEV